MTDTTQGEGASPAADELSLFQEATDNTLEAFENPKEPAEKPVDKPAEKPPEEKPQPEKPEDVQSLMQRLREEGEARRRVERERDEYATRMAQFAKPPQQPPEKPDLFADPEKFVMSLVKPLLDRQAEQAQLERENTSMERAAERFGPEMVAQSRGALEHFMKSGDPQAWDIHGRAMKSHDPYGLIVRWFHDRSTLYQLQQAGGIDALRKKEREEALKDPEYLKTALEYAKKNATASGNFANRPPVTAAIPNMPSLGNIGAGGGDANPVEPSDFELFRAATSAKRR
jgi:hypothetical protein